MHLLGVRIDNISMEQALQKIRGFLEDGRQHYVVTPNPDFLVLAQKDKEFREILNKADLSVPDGIGIVLASWLLGEPLKERVTGVDLINKFKVQSPKFKIFLLGGRNNVARIASRGWPEVIGFTEETAEAVNVINCIQPNILLVALGAPKQEKWITQNLTEIPSVKVAIGVGGALNFISGQTKRAPKIFQALGLEWLWRLFHEPRRWKKVWRSAVIFPFLIIKSLFLNLFTK